ncbi:hypothetical protein RFI_21108, partial [Reticulomyxa filosa]
MRKKKNLSCLCEGIQSSVSHNYHLYDKCGIVDGAEDVRRVLKEQEGTIFGREEERDIVYWDSENEFPLFALRKVSISTLGLEEWKDDSDHEYEYEYEYEYKYKYVREWNSLLVALTSLSTIMLCVYRQHFDKVLVSTVVMMMMTHPIPFNLCQSNGRQ